MAQASPATTGSEGEASEATARTPAQRFVRWCVLLSCLALLLWVGTFAYTRITKRPTPRSEYWLKRIADLDPPPPGAVSAAKARTLLNTPLPRVGSSLPLGGDWRKGSLREVGHAVFRAKLRNLSKRGFHATPLGTYRIPSFTSDGFLASLKADPDSDEPPWVAWVAALRLGRNIGRARTAMEVMVEARLYLGVAREMAHCAMDGVDPGISSQRLTEMVDEIIGPDLPFSKRFEGERLQMHRSLESIYVREGGHWLDVSEAAQQRWLRRKPSRLWNVTSPIFHDLPEARRRLDAFFDSLNHGPIAYNKPTANPDTALTELDGLQRESMTWVYSGLSRYGAARAALDAGVTALAIVAYQRDHGVFPESLAELVPEYLPETPHDSHANASFRYRASRETLSLYSLGADGVDNGGRHGDFVYCEFDLP